MLITCRVASSKISVITKYMFAIREDRKEQAKVVRSIEIDFGKTVSTWVTVLFPELKLNTFTVLLLWQQVSDCTNIRLELKGIKYYLFCHVMNDCL